jgi:hypothetical protein
MSAFSSSAEGAIERQVVIHPRKERGSKGKQCEQVDLEIERCVEWVKETKKERVCSNFQQHLVCVMLSFLCLYIFPLFSSS